MTNIRGCLSSLIRRIGGIASSLNSIASRIESSIKRIGSFLCAYERVGSIKTATELTNSVSVTSSRVCGIKSRMGLVCSPGLGYGVLWASDGRLVTIEGGFLIVRQYGA